MLSYIYSIGKKDMVKNARNQGVLKEKISSYVLVGILIIAAFLRLGFLSRGDAITDEVLYAFRAIGMVDFDVAVDQPTPLEWFDPNIPWWTHISFHDHPPLVFFVQYIFMHIFGETNFGFRLPGALLGICSVYLLYKIGEALYSREVGLIAAGALAVTANHVYISRIGMQETYVIFFILLTSYLFLRALKDSRLWLWTGFSLGLGFLAKYTILVLVPIFITYLLFFKRKDIVKNTYAWLGVGIFIVCTSPVVMYNAALYTRVGHFDFQFSFIFHQYPEVWKIAPGKEIGTVSDRIERFLPTLVDIHSWVLLCGMIVVLCGSLFFIFKERMSFMKRHAFLSISIFWMLILLIQIGPSYRFLSMLTPWLALCVGCVGFIIIKNTRRTFYIFAVLIVLFEIFYTSNSLLAYYPKGQSPWLYSKGVRAETYNWGYNELNAYLDKELAGKMPAQTFEVKYQFLEKLHEKAIDQATREGKEPLSAVIVYDGNVQNIAQLWTFDRLNMYHAWPTVKIDQYIEFMQANRYSDLIHTGFDRYYFIVTTDHVLQRKPENRTLFGRSLEAQFKERGIVPLSIYNKKGEEVFRVYKF